MARTKTESGITQHIVDADTPLSTTAVDTVNRNQLAINQQFGLEPFNQDRVEAEIALHLIQANHSFWEAGTRLIQLKENLQHGDFIRSLARIDIAESTARRLMTGALKYANQPTLADLTKRAGSKSKLLELAFLDDDDLQELNDGGTVAGLTLDDVERMTTRELKAALRKLRVDAKQSVDIKEQIIATKDKKLNELDQEVLRLKANKATEPEPVFKPVGADELEAIQKLTLHINAEIGGGLRHKIDALFNAYAGDYPPSAMRLAAAHAIGQMITTLHDVAGDYHIMPETEFVNAAKDPAQANAELMVNFETNGGRERLDAEVLAATQRREREARTTEEPPVYQQVDAWDDEVDAFDFDAPLDDE